MKSTFQSCSESLYSLIYKTTWTLLSLLTSFHDQRSINCCYLGISLVLVFLFRLERRVLEKKRNEPWFFVPMSKEKQKRIDEKRNDGLEEANLGQKFA